MRIITENGGRLWGTPEKIMRKNVESYEEVNEDEWGKVRKVIRKREESYDECYEKNEENIKIKWGHRRKMRKV